MSSFFLNETVGRVLKKYLLSLTLFVALVFSSSILLICHQATVVWADSEQASIEAANSSINQAFGVVLDAEKAGGNVTALLAELNEAGSLLAEAENAFRTGNLTEVTVKTGNATRIAENVRNEASNLRDTSLANSQNAFWFILLFSAISSAVFTLVLGLVWRRFRSTYLKKLLKEKPEVVTNET